MEGRIQKLYLAGTRTEARVARIKRTFMTLEYESMSRKDALTPFFKSAIVVLISSQGL